ncbi:MAG: aminotransferase class I/II-fold pyridoxal phosphate-dependent enzyme, partial [Actinocrinis sp.]
QLGREPALTKPRLTEPAPDADQPSVVVVGGGLAGLAAAVTAADAGWRVTLVESRPRLGGATHSFTRASDGTELSIDNGQHVFLRCCTAYRAFLRRLGVESDTIVQARLDIPVVDPATGRRARIRRDALPAPLHLARTLATYRLLSPAQRLRAIRGALASAPNDVFGYLAGSGMPELRTAIAGYLNRVRGTVAQPDQIVISTGYAQGIALLVGVLAARGATRLALEDPSSGDDALPAARAAGLEVTGIPVDRDGIRVDLLAASGAEAVVLTPSHQWPTGSVLSAGRRAAVLRWAAASGAVVIEDDYDSEYRYDRTPVGALQGMAPDRVVYAGSASKTLAPGLRLGWFVMPGHLAEPMAEAKIAADRGSPALEQLALADLIAKGEFDRHLRRMRPVYRRRRDALLAALSRRLPWLEPAGVSAGLHLVTWLPPGLGEATVVDAAAEAGVGIEGVTPYRISHPGPGGLIFGYATVSEQAIAEGVEILAGVIAGF